MKCTVLILFESIKYMIDNYNNQNVKIHLKVK